MDENAISANKCHNLVDVCLGPIESSSSGALFHVETLLKVTQQLQATYDSTLQLRIVNNSINAITIEKIQSVVEVSIFNDLHTTLEAVEIGCCAYFPK